MIQLLSILLPSMGNLKEFFVCNVVILLWEKMVPLPLCCLELIKNKNIYKQVRYIVLPSTYKDG